MSRIIGIPFSGVMPVKEICELEESQGFSERPLWSTISSNGGLINYVVCWKHWHFARSQWKNRNERDVFNGSSRLERRTKRKDRISKDSSVAIRIPVFLFLMRTVLRTGLYFKRKQLIISSTQHNFESQVYADLFRQQYIWIPRNRLGFIGQNVILNEQVASCSTFDYQGKRVNTSIMLIYS